jgi:molecular chaperone Hsp33
MDDLPPVEQALAAGRSPEAILDQLLAGIPYEVLERRELSYRCSCSRERSAQAIKLLGRAEIESLIAEGEAVVDCHFCHERYIFERGELETLLEAIAG